MKRLKSAIIGLGHQAIEDHIPGIKDSQFASLEAICDVNEKKLKEWKDKLGVPGFTDYGELFDSIDLDFIIAAVPHNEYRGIIEEAAKRHLHVLKEKPFARNLEEALYFKKLCDENDIELMVTLQRRFNPIYTTFFQLKDQIGEPFFVDMKYTLFVDKPHEGWRGKKEIPTNHPLYQYAVTGMGLKLRIHPIAATIANEQFDNLESVLEGRRKFAMKMINELSKEANPNYNQIVRWVVNKEEHAKKIQEIVSQYFLHQRVKIVASSDKEKYAKYVSLLTTLHEISVYAMKAKQSTDMTNIEKLKSSLDAFGKAYFHSH